jgi:L-alanine-DL-glutamate epimerase-like enolase superfamily enzyme
MSDMKIESIETIPVRVALDRTYRGSYYHMPNRCTVVTRITTSAGIVGEAYNADTDIEQAEILTIIERELAPALLGQDAFNIERNWETMNKVTRDQLRDRRIAIQAMACVDTALWDAIGKAVNQPLYRLWGGYRDAIPMIGIGGYYEEPGMPSIEDEVDAFLNDGMVGMKFKIGGRSPEVDAQRLKRAVDAAPEGWTFVVDANQGYVYREAVQFVKLASEFVDLRWFEEPCRWPDDRFAMRDIRMTGVPVAAGQSEISHAGARDLMTEGSIDVCNFDGSWGGGPTEWLRVAATAMLFNVELGHHEEPQLASHLLASQPHSTYVEAFHQERDPIFWQMLANRPELKDGLFTLPSGPGLGWELDADFIEMYRADR